MDFLYLSESDPFVIDFDPRREIVSKDRFLNQAKKYISTDEKTLLYRQCLFSDILKISCLSDFLVSLHGKLTEYAPLMQYSPQADNNEERIHNVLYPTVYIELVQFICDSLSPMTEAVTSDSLKHLYDLAKRDMESVEYRRLVRYYEANLHTLRRIKSVTIGVNLDALYRPTEAGIVSLHEKTFRSGDLLDRIIKLDFEKDDFHCLAPLTVIDKKLGYRESQQINYALLKAMGRVLDSGLHHCSNRLLKYVKERLAAYFAWLDSLTFVVEAIRRIQIFRDKKIPLCFPQVSNDRSFFVESLYDSGLSRDMDKKDIVPNTVHLDDSVHCYILSGPNSGGKTVFLNSLATAQYYFQLGMPIPAKSASLPICDAIYKISVEEQANVDLVGRFEKECISLSEVLKKFTPNSLALIDEAFTSTAAAEAVPIAANFIHDLCRLGGKCVFITHYHELSETEPKIRECGERVGYLHTELQGERRSYAIRKGKAEENSYAQNIAKKYGLLKD